MPHHRRQPFPIDFGDGCFCCLTVKSVNLLFAHWAFLLGCAIMWMMIETRTVGAQKEEEYVKQIRRNAQAVSARAQGRHLHGDATDRQAGRASQGNRRHSTGDVRSAGCADEGSRSRD